MKSLNKLLGPILGALLCTSSAIAADIESIHFLIPGGAGRREDAQAEVEALGMDVEILTECTAKFYFRDTSDRERLRKWVRKAAHSD